MFVVLENNPSQRFNLNKGLLKLDETRNNSLIKIRDNN